MNEKEIIEKVSNNDCYCNTGHDRDDLIFCRHCVDRGISKAIKLCNDSFQEERRLLEQDFKETIEAKEMFVKKEAEAHKKEIEKFIKKYSGNLLYRRSNLLEDLKSLKGDVK